MSISSSNRIPLSPTDDDKPAKNVLFSELNQLVQDSVGPGAETLFPALVAQLEAHQKGINNDQDVMRWMDFTTRLKKSESSLKSDFIHHLIRTDSEQPTPEEGELTLALLDNAELDHKLLWLSATRHFDNGPNSERLCRIRNCLETAYPHHDGTYPAMPERICESLSSALQSLDPECDIHRQLFIWAASHLQTATDELWLRVDELLSHKGLKPQKASPEASAEKNVHSPPGQQAAVLPGYPHQQPQGAHQRASPELDSPLFMADFADMLISRLEDMLAEDELIPEAKANRVKAVDLSHVLSSLQREVLEQQALIKNLHISIIDALQVQGVSSKLSRHHEDLINMIGWLFEFILENHNLPDEVKKNVALLQIPILKRAILEDDFFIGGRHPARQLLNSITSAGMQYCQDPNLGKHVLLLIEHTVRTITADQAETADIFQECLDGFQYNLDIILQPASGDAENPCHPAENNGLSEEQQEAATERGSTTDMQPKTGPEEKTEPEDEIILSSGLSETHENDTLLADEVSVAPAEGELAMGDEPDAPVTEQQDALSPLEPIIIEGLHPGKWVEFIGEGDSHRLLCKLARLSKDGHRYIFVNRSGMRVAEWSGIALRKGIDNGSVRMQEENPIFDRAIRAVLERFKFS